ncbi:MAG: response regulator [Magnetococcus sp. DMHC-6]
MKILIVDDEKNNRQVLAQIMAPFGEYDFAKDGREALEIFQLAIEDKTPYQLVLLDIMMPIMNGQEALFAMRAFEKEKGYSGSKETSIFIVSALDTEKQVVEAFFKGGCTDYITKPIIRSHLLAKLREYHLIPAETP